MRDLETAFTKCEHRIPCDPDEHPYCDKRDLHLMEGAVGFYAGSLEGHDGTGQGLLMYDLADKLCVDFRTCGEHGNKAKGTSKLNLDLFALFDEMQEAYLGHNCVDARSRQDRVAALINVPLVQGTLRQAYINHHKPGASLNDEAKGAAFALGIIPVVAKCSQGDARIIYDNMKPQRGFATDFDAVKGAFERNYACMRITCEDIGGYYYNGGLLGGHYYPGADACVTEGYVDPDKLTTGQIVGITVGALFATLLACCCYGFWKLPRRTRQRRHNKRKKSDVEFVPPPSTGVST